MDGIIKRTDREIKSLKNEEATLKKVIAEKDEVFILELWNHFSLNKS